jgi:alkylated DNA repair dioxygenase AlkB
VQRQLDLFATPSSAIGFDAGFRALRRTELGRGAWVDYQPEWVTGHDALFDRLARELPWQTETRRMYDRIVQTPRLLAIPPKTGLLEEMRAALSARYGEELVHVTAALYRDGRDSVAWHGDTTARDMLEALVVTVSLGEPRRFLLRPAEQAEEVPARELRTWMLGRGDLIAMGGTCQRTWRHAVPKVARAGPRISLMFRPSWARDYVERDGR